jgi:hypothetical protein
MSDNEVGADPLVTAIGEFRQELVGWIDTLLGSIRQRHARTASRSPEQAAPLQGPVKRYESRGDSGVETAGGSPQREENRTSAADPPAKGDPRHRLDALARQLGERLKSSEAARGGSERAESEVPVKERNKPPG